MDDEATSSNDKDQIVRFSPSSNNSLENINNSKNPKSSDEQSKLENTQQANMSSNEPQKELSSIESEIESSIEVCQDDKSVQMESDSQLVSSRKDSNAIIMSASKLAAQTNIPVNTKDTSRSPGDVASVSHSGSNSMTSSSISSGAGSGVNEATITNDVSPGGTKNISSISSTSLVTENSPILAENSTRKPLPTPETNGNKSSQNTPVASNQKTSPGNTIQTKKKTPRSSKKPWYSAFINTYKQKNEDFRRLFKLPSEEHLLVDYACALQREILAQGRLYISLNYLCFRANIIGWETTLIIRLKDIRSIYKDKTAKIIPNAISVVLDNEKYFFTSFISRDKTYTTLFRIWQIALADSSMSNEEIDTILKSCYGEDLGYNSDDAEYEYYSKLRDPKSSPTREAIFTTSEFNQFNKSASFNIASDQRVNPGETSSAKEMIFSDSEAAGKHARFESTSFSDDQSAVKKGAAAQPSSPKRNQQVHSSSSSASASSFAPYNHVHHSGHRQSSSFDTAMIDISESLNLEPGQVDSNERPRSMVVSVKQQPKQIERPKTMQVVLSSTVPTSLTSVIDSSITEDSMSTNEETKEISSGRLSSAVSPLTNGQSDSSSSVDFDLNSGIGEESISGEMNVQMTTSITTNVSGNVKCSCADHPGKEMLNQVYSLTVNYLWECLFGHTTFCRNYWESRKFGNIKVGEWKLVDSRPFRQLEYTVDLGGAIGRPKNIEEQKILEYRPNECIVLESESYTQGVPYSDYFTVRNRFCLSTVSPTSTRLCIYSFLNFVQRPNFIAKNFIERHTMGALRDSYNYLEKNIPTIPQPTNQSRLPAHISAITSDTAKSGSGNAKAGHKHKTQIDHSDLNGSATNKRASNHQISTDIGENVSQPPPVKTSAGKKKRSSQINAQNDGSIGINSDESSSLLSPGADYTRGRTSSSVSPQVQTQLVPIQKFSFFKLEINVDTLVRLFIVAMICLMVINGMLYYKLRRIESLADSIRNDPSLMAKVNAPEKQFESVFIESSRSNVGSESNDWRNLISKTLDAIEKMENSLRQWDKTLESRELKKVPTSSLPPSLPPTGDL